MVVLRDDAGLGRVQEILREAHRFHLCPARVCSEEQVVYELRHFALIISTTLNIMTI